MKKISQVILTSLALVLLIVSPACKKKTTPVVTPSGANTTTMRPPDVDPPPPLPSETTVPDRPDFVQETPTEETVPSDIEELNRWVQRQGHVRDAFYNYDEATLDDAAQAALTASATWLKGQGAGYSLLVEGHCDERGTEQYNLALGDKRANSAKDYLVTLGVDARRIRTVSYGEERPFEEGHDDAAWSQNRRAHLVLVR
jgi:peptidoglycan-associated lipoprotein